MNVIDADNALLVKISMRYMDEVENGLQADLPVATWLLQEFGAYMDKVGGQSKVIFDNDSDAVRFRLSFAA